MESREIYNGRVPNYDEDEEKGEERDIEIVITSFLRISSWKKDGGGENRGKSGDGGNGKSRRREEWANEEKESHSV